MSWTSTLYVFWYNFHLSTFYGISIFFFSSPSTSLKKVIYWVIVCTGSNVYSIWFTCSFSQGNAWPSLHCYYAFSEKCFIYSSMFCRYGRRVVTTLLSGFAISPKLVHTRLGARERHEIAAVKTWDDFMVDAGIFLHIWVWVVRNYQEFVTQGWIIGILNCFVIVSIWLFVPNLSDMML